LATQFRTSIYDAGFVPVSPALPLCHVSDCSTILGFAKNLTIHADDEPCDVFNEKLNYFFYGRAAYRPRTKQMLSMAVAQPASIILKSTGFSTPYAVYPFDTGGFGRYADATGKKSLADFALERELSDAEHLVARYWKNPISYASVDLTDFNELSDPNCEEVERYSSLVKLVSSDVADERRSAVEISFDADVELKPENVLGIVLPAKYSENAAVKALKASGTKIQPYTYRVGSADRMMALVSELSFRIVVDHVSPAEVVL
jgi:hypothetical protein